ncbi:tRNA pseudouridine(13) synthase TruD [Lysobacter soli]|uniref:tRNA pseudouridine(13) synthase TruD n=1 Tax=Lysobacter soli TaxID=453783 RepID=UPI0024100A17|nr:tRNA pseudouridine(13) synthase TruD [Lysobacter soli]MDG2516549.1 tRNA pseudouridine(13) synthase TruD [Lysobacter soli]
MSEAALPRAHGEAVLSANMRTTPEDFIVEELPGFEPSGAGEHLLLTVEKRGMNTGFAAKHIAQWAGVGEVAIGYAGLKDRHAVTRQRFSVHLPKKVAPDLSTLDFAQGEERLTVVEYTWHAKKLPRGAMAGNRFVLTLRGVSGERAAVEQRLQSIAERGVPNYFGEQRFGRDGDNVANARAMFAGRRVRREQRTLLMSAARSELFNRVLAQRVQRGCWDTPLNGEVWMLDGSRSVFGPAPFDDALAQRLASFDIHPTGPLWGRGELRSTGDAARLETEALSGEEALALRAGLEAEGLKQERRALRLKPSELTWSWREDDVLEIAFALPPGAYATVVLAELGDVRAVGRAG